MISIRSIRARRVQQWDGLQISVVKLRQKGLTAEVEFLLRVQFHLCSPLRSASSVDLRSAKSEKIRTGRHRTCIRIKKKSFVNPQPCARVGRILHRQMHLLSGSRLPGGQIYFRTCSQRGANCPQTDAGSTPSTGENGAIWR